jgi:hypothetical protein
MRRTKLLGYVLCLAIVVVIAALLIAGTARADNLPKDLPTSHCSTLHHLHGKALWRHWIWHLDRPEYARICATIWGESRWNPQAENSGHFAGLMQWGMGWYQGWKWYWPFRFNPHDPVLSIRMMVYNLRHADKYGGWSNWYPH